MCCHEPHETCIDFHDTGSDGHIPEAWYLHLFKISVVVSYKSSSGEVGRRSTPKKFRGVTPPLHRRCIISCLYVGNCVSIGFSNTFVFINPYWILKYAALMGWSLEGPCAFNTQGHSGQAPAQLAQRRGNQLSAQPTRPAPGQLGQRPSY